MKNTQEMTLPQIVRPLMQFFYNLLGKDGQTWLFAFKRFLRKENPWENWKVWKSVDVGTNVLEEILTVLKARPLTPRYGILETSPKGRWLIDNGDGTVTDTKTGLMWVKNPHTDLSEKFKGEMKWQEAVDACKALNFAGHKDWRLSTREELFSLTDDTRYSPAINKEAFPDTKSSWYWTITPLAGDPGGAWIVNFNSGNVDYCRKDGSYYVRPVRSSQ